MFKKYVSCALSVILILTFFDRFSETDCASTLVNQIRSTIRINKEQNHHYINVSKPSDISVKTPFFGSNGKLVIPAKFPSSSDLHPMGNKSVKSISVRTRRSPYPPAYYLASIGCNCLPGHTRCVCSKKKSKSHKWAIYQ